MLSFASAKSIGKDNAFPSNSMLFSGKKRQRRKNRHPYRVGCLHLIVSTALLLPIQFLAVELEEIIVEKSRNLQKDVGINGFLRENLIDVCTTARQLPCKPNYRFAPLFQCLFDQFSDVYQISKILMVVEQ